jgi:hypothetical protein
VADPICYEENFSGLCSKFWCGGRAGSLDEDGCLRTLCESDADCVDGERCYVIALDEYCKTSEAFCNVEDGECICGALGDCDGFLEAHCLSGTEFPPEGDCDISGLDCVELSARSQGLQGAEAHCRDEGNPALLPMLADCAEKLASASIAAPCSVPACEVLCDWSCDVPPDCVQLCETTSASAEPGALEAVLAAVIQHPELCWTCEVCTYAGDTGGLCEQLFDC